MTGNGRHYEGFGCISDHSQAVHEEGRAEVPGIGLEALLVRQHHHKETGVVAVTPDLDGEQQEQQQQQRLPLE